MNVSPFVLLAAVAVAGTAHAAPGCDTPEHRAFDFWLGDWEVYANDQRAGTNRIEKTLDGCALTEHWLGASGEEGRSVNAWDAANRQWRQLWVATRGNVLLLAGGVVDGAMVMEGVQPNAKTGKPQRQRIAWTRGDDGSVRQLWETSDDDGANWQVSFDGRYRRAAPGDSAP
jgi:hypothetical protein